VLFVASLSAHYEFLKDFAGPVATIFAALVAAGITFYFGLIQRRIAAQQTLIARQQAELARVRLQHDRYERRIAVFEAIRDLIFQEFSPSGSISIESARLFVRRTNDAMFLFSEDIAAYVEEMTDKAFRLGRTSERWHREASIHHPNEPASFAELQELNTWFSSQYKVAVEKFTPFLSLDEHSIQ
jgi:hypothetical protein